MSDSISDKYYSLFVECIDAVQNETDLKEPYLEFEEEGLRLLESSLDFPTFSDVCEIIFSCTDFFWDNGIDQTLEYIAYSKLYSRLVRELIVANDNYRRWSIWDMFPTYLPVVKENEMRELIYRFILDNNPTKEDLELVKAHRF